MLAKKPKGATQKRGTNGAAGLVWMFVGAILTVMIGFFLYLWNPFDMGAEPVAQERRTVQPINSVGNEEGNYEFYDLLPEQEITSIPDSAIIDPADSEVSNPPETLQPDVVIVVPRAQARMQEAADAANNSATDSPTAANPDASNGNNGNKGNATSSDKDAAANASAPNSATNYGISEDSILNPLQSQNSPAADADNKVVIVEEGGTYDEPGSASKPSSTPKPNNTGNSATVPKESNKGAGTASTAAAPAANVKKTYILQINSYSGSEEADKRRAQVLMAGVDARVVKRKMANGQVFYQVVSTQMSNAQRVKLAQQKLQNNGIDSLIVEQQHP